MSKLLLSLLVVIVTGMLLTTFRLNNQNKRIEIVPECLGLEAIPAGGCSFSGYSFEAV